jgi:hypothetical protein
LTHKHTHTETSGSFLCEEWNFGLIVLRLMVVLHSILGFQIVVNDTTIVVNPLDDVLFTTDLAREDCLDTVLAEIKSLKEEEAAAGAAVVEEEDEDNLHPPSHVRTEVIIGCTCRHKHLDLNHSPSLPSLTKLVLLILY